MGRLRLGELEGNYTRSEMWLTLTEPKQRESIDAAHGVMCHHSTSGGGQKEGQHVPFRPKECVSQISSLAFEKKKMISFPVFCNDCHTIRPLGFSQVLDMLGSGLHTPKTGTKTLPGYFHRMDLLMQIHRASDALKHCKRLCCFKKSLSVICPLYREVRGQLKSYQPCRLCVLYIVLSPSPCPVNS